jgi:hypothetical protein
MGDLVGYSALVARINAVQSPVTRRNIGRRWQVATVRGAKIRAPRRTSNMARTIHAGESTDVSATVLVSANYAAAVELGRRAVDIYPRPGRIGRNGRPAALAWGGARRQTGSLRTGASPTTFARAVHQPARPGRPFLRPAAIEALEQEAELVDVIVDAWNGAA